MLRQIGCLSLIGLLLFTSACQTGSTDKKDDPTKQLTTKTKSGFSLVPPEHSGIDFNNSVTEDVYFNFLFYPYILTGGGVAVADINKDGLTDIYFSANQGNNKLYLNKGNLQFEDITSKAGVADADGWTTGLSFVDINVDGNMDIYVCKSASTHDDNARKNKLFINNGNNTFTENASKYGLDDNAFSIQSYFFDYDKDGDLDMYLVNHRTDFNNNSRINTEIQNDISPLTSDKLYRNDGGRFKDVTNSAGIANKAWGLSASISDFNEDGWPDIYVCNDYLEPDRLLINQQNGTFVDEVHTIMDHISFYSMGSDIGDVNNDGKPDLVVLDMVPGDHVRSKRNMSSMSTDMFMTMVNVGYHHQYMANVLQLNNGDGNYSEVGHLAGIAKTDWSWAPLMADFDNDGWQDLYVTNGIKRDVTDNDYKIALMELSKSGTAPTLEEIYALVPSTKTSNHVFRNSGELKFTDETGSWNLGQKGYSNGAAYADLDNDGDLELVVNNVDDVAYIYENLTDNKAITVTLKGPDENPNGIGAQITVKTSDGEQFREQFLSRGFQSSITPDQHFGIGQHNTVESVTVIWPDGNSDSFEDIKAGSRLIAAYKQGGKMPESGDVATYFEQLDPSDIGLNYVHNDPEFNDFAREILLPQKQSTLGPHLSQADVNGDGKADLFIGGAKDVAPSLFIQSDNGQFENSSQSAFISDIGFEDLSSGFFDADNDGDMDLYVASGGNEFVAGSASYLDRLYLNDGKGNFKRNQKALPDLRSNSMSVAPGDFDGDGDMDLFIGAKAIPGKYPFPDKSYLLQNDGGTFTDVTKSLAPDLNTLGMVNDAVFSDYDRDGDPDLILVGEWMPVTIFRNEQGRFMEKKIINGSSGWWYSITAADLDSDGDEDYILGNLGLNNKFGANPNKPFHVYASDFDNSGTLDIVLSKEGNDGLLPVRGRECSSQQMPFIEEKFPTYRNFAEAKLDDIYGTENLSNALHLTTETFASGYIINEAETKMELTPLPIRAQFGPLLSAIVTDLNNDDHPDLIGVGNIYNAEVETIRYDASKGFTLSGSASGNFNTISSSGLQTSGNVKDMVLMDVNGVNMLIIAVNNGPLQVYRTATEQ